MRYTDNLASVVTSLAKDKGFLRRLSSAFDRVSVKKVDFPVTAKGKFVRFQVSTPKVFDSA